MLANAFLEFAELYLLYLDRIGVVLIHKGYPHRGLSQLQAKVDK